VLDRLEALSPTSKGIHDVFKGQSELSPEDWALAQQNPVRPRRCATPPKRRST
jgi:hypothetical protein